MALARIPSGNAHLTREQLFTNLDSYYSHCYAGSRGNIRSFFESCPAGTRLNTRIAQFRLKARTEVSINWFRMNVDAVTAVIGE